ncbi:hypothetical protein JAAARDRAFT_36748 [Jaapia argillacea MUCL 33604]|uniref:Uncharacterized protein n=1 Tax=Jaapia argillacea MUCL 33604 TaxID=933084 RepID=A0A067PXH6_9AGAM|nr:hypothetical protein JAAARDRAFT_36748 [Jaapia argillacea MUCL 33604]
MLAFVAQPSWHSQATPGHYSHRHHHHHSHHPHYRYGYQPARVDSYFSALAEASAADEYYQRVLVREAALRREREQLQYQIEVIRRQMAFEAMRKERERMIMAARQRQELANQIRQTEQEDFFGLFGVPQYDRSRDLVRLPPDFVRFHPSYQLPPSQVASGRFGHGRPAHHVGFHSCHGRVAPGLEPLVLPGGERSSRPNCTPRTRGVEYSETNPFEFFSSLFDPSRPSQETPQTTPAESAPRNDSRQEPHPFELFLSSLFDPTTRSSPGTPQPQSVDDTKVDAKGKGKEPESDLLQDVDPRILRHRLSERRRRESEPEVQAALDGLLAKLSGTGESPSAPSGDKKVRFADPSTPYSTSAAPSTTVQQPVAEASASKTASAERADETITFEDLFSNLLGAFFAGGADAERTSVPTSDTSKAPAEEGSTSESRTPPTSGRSTAASKILSHRARRLISSIQHDLELIQSSFTFPNHLDFVTSSTPSSPSSSTSQLSYSPSNASIHSYIHSLNELLTRLDGVESYGDEGVRRERRGVVKMVESAIESVEGLVREMGEREVRDAKEAEEERGRGMVFSVPIQDGSVDAQVLGSATPEVVGDISTTPVPEQAAERQEVRSEEVLVTTTASSIESHALEDEEQVSSVPVTAEVGEMSSTEEEIVVEPTPVVEDSPSAQIPEEVIVAADEHSRLDSDSESLIDRTDEETPFTAEVVTSDTESSVVHPEDIESPDSATAGEDSVDDIQTIWLQESVILPPLVTDTVEESPNAAPVNLESGDQEKVVEDLGDAFLLPTATPPPRRHRPAFEEDRDRDEVVVVEEEKEGSDWSEVEA